MFIVLFLGEAILERNDAVERVFELGILAEVAYAYKLESVAGLCIFKTRLDHSSLYLCERIGIEEVKIGLSLGHVCGVLDVEQAVVKHERYGLCVLGGEPMDRALDLSAVSGHSVACFKICGGVNALDRAVLVLFDSCILVSYIR